MKSLLIMAPFWDPYCPPLGITSIQAYMKSRNRDVAIYDFNTEANIWRLQRQYFNKFVEVVPEAANWNIMRLGPDYFARHQMAWLRLRHQRSDYLDLVHRIVNIDGKQNISLKRLEDFDPILEHLYSLIQTKTDEIIAEHQPDSIGCTLLTTTLPASLEILRRARELNPKIRTVLGGPGPIMGAGAESPDTHRILEHCDWLDNIVIGEGEVLMDAFHHGKFEKKKIYSLEHVEQFTKDPELAAPVRIGLIRDISQLPTPDYTGLKVGSYTDLSLGISRGCSYQCSFCYETTYWKKYRKRPIEGALDDLEVLSKKYNRSNFFMCDSLANMFADELAEGNRRRDLGIKWDAYLRADKPLLDQSYVNSLADGGMVRARLGLESADEQTLQEMNKKTTADVMGEVIENLARAGIQTSTLWIVGFPNEDEAAFQASLDFLSRHKESIYAADPWQFIFHPTVGDQPVFGRLVAEDSYESKYGMRRLYPEKYDEALLVQYYELDIDDVIATKLNRLKEMCATMEEHGIPNPYSMKGWRAAKARWLGLHPPRPKPVKQVFASVS